MGTHMPHGITQCYLPPVRGDIPTLWSGSTKRSGSIRLSHHLTAAAACSGSADECHVGRRCLSTASATQQQTGLKHGTQQHTLAVLCWQLTWRGWTQTCFHCCCPSLTAHTSFSGFPQGLKLAIGRKTVPRRCWFLVYLSWKISSASALVAVYFNAISVSGVCCNLHRQFKGSVSIKVDWMSSLSCCSLLWSNSWAASLCLSNCEPYKNYWISWDAIQSVDIGGWMKSDEPCVRWESRSLWEGALCEGHGWACADVYRL